jgi:hypothetical protein
LVEPSDSMDMVWELLVCVLQFKSNCIITNKIYHKKRREIYFTTVQFSDLPSKLHTHTYTLQLKYVSYDTRDQITCTLKYCAYSIIPTV